MNRNKIEERIKPLVDILNEIHYISTFSSCEGHYCSDLIDKHKAEVVFNVTEGYEHDFENLATLILSESVIHWDRALVEVFKQFYVLPGEKELKTKYQITIKPLEQDITPEQKREYTDLIIEIIVSAVKSHSESHNIALINGVKPSLA